MATEKWIAGSGQGFTWGTALNTADMTSLANNSGVMSSVADITNQTSLDLFADFSISLASLAVVAPAFVGVYVYPLNQDGTTYGDGQFASGTQTAKVPSSTYYVGSIILWVGTAIQQGTLTRIIIPPGSFRFLLYNQAGIVFSASTNTAKYRTYNRSVA